VPADRTVLCCEVTEVDKFSPERVIDELARTGIIKREDVLDVKTIELPNAYPIYDRGYEQQMESARTFFAAHPNIYQVGRQARFAHKDLDEIFEEAKQVAGQLIAMSKSRESSESGESRESKDNCF
jgi:protoporphyrinogen oxidase